MTAITSEKSAGKPITSIFPHLAGLTSLVCEPLDPDAIAKKADFVFLALPHVTAQEAAFRFHKLGKKVVDLSADYRLADPALYETWYEHGHQYPELLKDAVYGLPELHREKIKKASLDRKPGVLPHERDPGACAAHARGQGRPGKHHHRLQVRRFRCWPESLARTPLPGGERGIHGLQDRDAPAHAGDRTGAFLFGWKADNGFVHAASCAHEPGYSDDDLRESKITS